MKKLLSAILTSVVLFTAGMTAFGQDTAETSVPEAIFTDVLFNDYIQLETMLLGNYTAKTLNTYDLGRIESLRQQAAAANRRDILNRLDMLEFIVRDGLKEQEAGTDPEAFLAALKDEERKYRAEAAAAKTARTVTGISIGTAIASGTIFAASALISSDYYTKYTETEYADQAAFYLFWWQTLDTVSLVSAITTLAAAAAAGIFAVIY